MLSFPAGMMSGEEHTGDCVRQAHALSRCNYSDITGYLPSTKYPQYTMRKMLQNLIRLSCKACDFGSKVRKVEKSVHHYNRNFSTIPKVR